jgi:hypothetical protein
MEYFPGGHQVLDHVDRGAPRRPVHSGRPIATVEFDDHSGEGHLRGNRSSVLLVMEYRSEESPLSRFGVVDCDLQA